WVRTKDGASTATKGRTSGPKESARAADPTTSTAEATAEIFADTPDLPRPDPPRRCAETTRSPASARLRVILGGRAAADELPVAEDVVQPSHRGPELGRADKRGGERPELPGVRAVPGIGGDHLGGVRGVLEHVPLARLPSGLDLADLLADGDHR